MFYVSYRSEADTRELIRNALAKGRRVAVPRVEGEELTFYCITSFSQLTEGYRGILEPDVQRSEPVCYEDYTAERVLLFAPGCAFDKSGGRLGYGGGFYDRFLQKHPELYCAGVAFAVQLVEKVPCGEQDKRVSCVITEQEITEAGESMEEERHGARAKRAMELFREGYNCTQSVVLAFADYYKESPETLAAMVCSFGGGMGRLREVCGAVSGIFFVIGRLYGYSDPKVREKRRNTTQGCRSLREGSGRKTGRLSAGSC